MGEGYEAGEVFLPQLMASAEAARTACDMVRASIPRGTGNDYFPNTSAATRADWAASLV